MTERLDDAILNEIADLFRRGRTYKEIAAQLDMPMNSVISTLCGAGFFRDQLMARRIVINQMAQDGIYVEDIAAHVGLKVDTVKGHLHRSRIKYTIKPKGK
jgi:DNA-binding NarL/FixJ family response regulator